MLGLNAIRGLRGMYPREGPWRLTVRIYECEFVPETMAWKLANRIGSRTPYSIYSVIRRYDARRKQRKAA